ncbi:hypothetical protein [Nostoc sp. NOS(2021)]|nr:hypothetical protein [Nostoc sp. NOS(2021)]
MPDFMGYHPLFDASAIAVVDLYKRGNASQSGDQFYSFINY